MNFTFIENIQTRYQSSLTNSLRIESSTPKEALIIRLITGTVKIRNIYSDIEVVQSNNYSILGIKNYKIISTRPIKDSLSTPLSLRDLECYLSKTNHVNDPYYLLLLEEFSSYFFKKEKQSFTTAFVHLYRILEYISYSFPLIYSSFSRDYFGTYNKLKNYFDGSKSELLFFETFIEKVIDETSRDAPIEFNFSNLDRNLSKNYYRIVRNFITDNDIISEVPNESIILPYKKLFKVVIDIRNRYFHFAVGGQRNIKSTEIIECDEFFKLINEHILNWISFVYFEILNNSISIVNRY